MSIRYWLAVCSVLALFMPSLGQGVGPKAEAEPESASRAVLRLEAGGPTAQVTAVAFSPDSQTLYAAGYDKVVRVWQRQKAGGKFVLAPFAYRVPIGPGTGGVINALAVSPDGQWLAATGLGVARGEAGFKEEGRVFPIDAMTREMKQDRAPIFLFSTRTAARGNPPEARILRGHAGVGYALMFAPAHPDKPPLLVSAARESGASDAAPNGRLCIWDVNKAAVVDSGAEPKETDARLAEWTFAGLTGLTREVPPRLAVRHTGKQVKQVHVGIAWSDGNFRVWDVASGEVEPARDGVAGWNNTVAYLPGDRVLTGGYDGKVGYLRTWRDQPGKKVELVSSTSFTDPDYAYLLPRSLSLFTPASGEPSRAAVVLQVKGAAPENRFQLRLVSLSDLRSEVTVDLGPQRGSNPILAASPDGSLLAVVRGGERVIRVYTTADLLKVRDAYEPQPLESVGVQIATVAFARKAGQALPGLFLSKTPLKLGERPAAMARDDLIFDPVGRTLGRDPEKQGWEIAEPWRDGWALQVIPPDNKQDRLLLLPWKGPAGQEGKVVVRLKPREDATAAVLLPPVEGLKGIPNLAVATWDAANREPLLALYHGKTGDLLRHLVGHVQPIQSLGPSADGRLLASTAADQTVCVWSLTDLDQIIGQHGTLRGARFRTDKEAPILAEDGQGNADVKALKADDRIKGMAFKENGRLLNIETAYAFYDALWGVKPKDKVWLRVESNGVARTVPVEVGQGVDDRKPLLSLFLAPGEKGGLEWIAWTPQGVYDAGGEQIEEKVGWHFNPKDFGGSVRFARIKEYPSDFYQPKLLAPLLAHANLGKAVEEIKKRKPILKADPEVRVLGTGLETMGDGAFLVRDPNVTVRVTIHGPSLEKGEIESARMEFDGKQESFDLVKDVSGPSELSRKIKLPKRGKQTIRVVVRTKDPDHEPVDREVAVRFHLPPPTLEIDDPAKPKTPLKTGMVVKKVDFKLLARIPDNARFRVVQFNRKDQPAPAATTLDQPVKLVDGENAITIRASLADSRPEDEPFESIERTVVVVLQKTAAPIPVFTRVEVGGRELAVESGKQTIVVDARTVRLLAKVTAQEELTLVELRTMGKALASKRPERSKEFALDQTVKVSVEAGGTQEFVLAARTENSDPPEPFTSVLIKYVPGLPEVIPIPLPDRMNEGSDRKGPPKVEVKGLLNLPTDFHPFEVVVRVFDQDAPPEKRQASDEDVNLFKEQPAGGSGQVLLGKVQLKHKKNRIEISVKNQWHSSEPLVQHIVWRRPPYIVSLTAPKPIAKDSTDVTAEVNTPSDQPLTHVLLNGHKYEKDDLKKILVDSKEDKVRNITVWKVQIKEVKLKKGSNPIPFAVGNPDGSDEKEEKVTLTFDPNFKSAVIDVKSELQVAAPRYELKVRIQSPESKLKWVGIQGPNDREPQAQDLAGQKPDDLLRFYEINLTVPYILPGGSNTFVIKAENEGAPVEERVTVSYVRQPVALELDSPGDSPKPPKLRLAGRILWSADQPDAEIEAHLNQVRVYVNGFRQRRPDFQPAAEQVRPGVRKREFSVEILLNQPENQVVAEAPGMPLDEKGKPAALKVLCDNPQKPDTLRLFIVNAAERQITEEKLAAQAMKAIQLKPEGEGLCNGAFRQVIAYPSAPKQLRPLTPVPHLRKYTVQRYLSRIQDDIKARASPNDVVLICWIGKEGSENGERYLLTGDSESQPREKLSTTAIPLRDLLGADDPDVVGARIVLLDVSSTAEEKDRPKIGSGVALMRQTWSVPEVPLPGLLLAALEAAGKGGRRTVLEDMLGAAAALRKSGSYKATEFHNLTSGTGLARLILVGEP